jgi:hypothetical protein
MKPNLKHTQKFVTQVAAAEEKYPEAPTVPPKQMLYRRALYHLIQGFPNFLARGIFGSRKIFAEPKCHF